MRYFTLDAYHQWHKCEDDEDSACREASDRYARHLEQLQGVLPGEVLALARLPGVDDGLVVRAQKDEQSSSLRLTMRCGDLVMGYYDLVLSYENASISPEHDQVLAWVARSTNGHRDHRCDVADHELDRSDDGQIEHRLLFHPGVWFAIRCDRVRWEQVSRPDRRLPRSRDRYPGGPPTVTPEGID